MEEVEEVEVAAKDNRALNDDNETPEEDEAQREKEAENGGPVEDEEQYSISPENEASMRERGSPVRIRRNLRSY
ncbi:MAG: hypothetical protein LQ352_007629, partial [Teloschistes flavicans]